MIESMSIDRIVELVLDAAVSEPQLAAAIDKMGAVGRERKLATATRLDDEAVEMEILRGLRHNPHRPCVVEGDVLNQDIFLS